jgi:hypothetical protein
MRLINQRIEAEYRGIKAGLSELGGNAMQGSLGENEIRGNHREVVTDLARGQYAAVRRQKMECCNEKTEMKDVVSELRRDVETDPSEVRNSK